MMDDIYCHSLEWLFELDDVLDIFYWKVQFLSNVVINKTKVVLSQEYVTLPDFRPFCFIVPTLLNDFTFQPIDYERT